MPARRPRWRSRPVLPPNVCSIVNFIKPLFTLPEEDADFITEQDVDKSLKLAAKENRDCEVIRRPRSRRTTWPAPTSYQAGKGASGPGRPAGWTPRRYYRSPYPKAAGGFRQMAATDPVHWVIYRSRFPGWRDHRSRALRHVFGNRLERAGPGRRGSDRRVDRLPGLPDSESLAENEWKYTCISDISGFYPNIDPPRLFGELRRLGVDDEVVRPLERLLTFWGQSKPLLVGLLVGSPAGGSQQRLPRLPRWPPPGCCPRLRDVRG